MRNAKCKMQIPRLTFCIVHVTFLPDYLRTSDQALRFLS
jgi:hypothetical protein